MRAALDRCMSRPKPLVIFDSLLWYAYLLLLILVSFQAGGLASAQWSLIASGLFAIVALHFVSVLLGGPYNRGGLFASRYASLAIIASVMLLCLQLLVPYSTAWHQALSAGQALGGAAPRWYQPDVVWSVVPQQTQWLLLTEALMLTLFLLTVSLVCNRARAKQLLFIMLCVGVSHAFLGIVAKFAGLSLVDLQQVDGHFDVARGWFINRNHFGAFLSLTMIGVLVALFKIKLAVKNQNPLSLFFEQLLSTRILLWVALFLCISAIAMSQSRAGFFGLITAVLLSLILVKDASKALGPKRNIVLLTSLVSVAAAFYFGSDLVERLSSESSFLGERVLQWQLTWQAIQKEWLLGYGGNSYAVVFQLERGYSDLRQVLYDQSHNDYLHIWLEQGIVGLALWGCLILLTLKRARSAFSVSPSRLVKASMLATIIVVLAALMQASVDFNLHIPNIRYYFFVIIALPFAIPAIRQQKRRSTFSLLV